MARHKAAVWVCVWAYILACVSGVWLQNGAYEDLVLAIDPDMSEDAMDITQLEQKITEMMTEMSESMTKATNGRLSLGSVVVVLPHWGNSTDGFDLDLPDESISWNTADIRLQLAPTGTFGGYADHGPHTLQMGQCGVPGRYITIHDTFLDKDYAHTHYGPRGNVLMHEWAHYRWGVFEEYGHPEDPVYPVSYEQDGLSVPSACYEGELVGHFLTASEDPCPGAHDDPDNPCYFFPNASSDPATTMSSLMSHAYLSEGSFCTSDTHDMWAPTPQNKMCGQRSVWEVLEKHPDFVGVRNPRQQQTASTGLTISFQKAPMSRVFFLFEAPPASETDNVQKLVHSFITEAAELYGEIELGMATFRTKTPDGTEFLNEMNFTSVGDFSLVESYLPEANADPTTSETLLEDALLNLLPNWEIYQTGTLLVTMIWNPVVAKADQEDLSALILDKRVKLLVLDTSADLNDLMPMIPLLQNAGGNFYVQDAHSDPSDRLRQDLVDYLKYPGTNDHKLVGVSRQDVAAGKTEQLPTINVQMNLEKQINGYIRMTPFDPSSIELEINDPIIFTFIKCNDLTNELKLYCINAADGIFFYFYTLEALIFDYTMYIANSGSQNVAAEITWSVVEQSSDSARASLSVWSSEDSELKATVPENGYLFLYSQVSHPNGVPEKIQVTADVEFVSQGGDVSSQTISLTDAGDRGVDVKARDTVWTGQLAGAWPAGTTFTVTTLTVSPQASSSRHLDNTSRLRKSAEGGLAGGSSSVLPIDPAEGDCCLSFSDEKSLRNIVINQILRRPYRATINNDIQDVPPRLAEPPQLDPDNLPFIDKDTVKVTLLLDGTKTRQGETFQYSVRYHEDLPTLRDNFAGAKKPLEGYEAPGDATSILVTLPYDNSSNMDVYVAVATINPSSGVMSAPSTAGLVEVSSLTTPTTASTTTGPTTTTTSTTTTTTKKPPTTTTSTTTTSTPKTLPPATTHAPDDSSPDNTTIIVVSVVCAVVALGAAGGLFYYFKVYKRKA